MKTSLTNIARLAGVLLLTTYTSIAQQTERVWVTIENKSILPVENVRGELVSSDAEFQQLIVDFNIKSVDQAFSASRKESLLKVYELVCDCDALSLTTTIEQKNENLIQPEIGPSYELMTEPNDYHVTFNTDYALDIINAKQAWSYSTGDSNLIVGISDGNFYTSHEELHGKYVFYDNTNYSTQYSHGTAVAITVAGGTNNASGKSSIGYNCRLSLAGASYNKALMLSNAGAKVINMSWASSCYFSSYAQAVINEIYENGTICVAAAGNGNTCGNSNNLVYPASFEHIISVTSVGPYNNHERVVGNPNTTHQHNVKVDIAAPGYDVALTTAPGNYSTGSGTSFATPFVTGTVALMLSANPCLTFEDVEEILKTTAQDLDVINPQYAGKLGAGLLNAGEAVRIAKERSCLNPPVISNDDEIISDVNYKIEGEQISGTQNEQADPEVESTNNTNITFKPVDNVVFSPTVKMFPNPTTSATKIMWNETPGQLVRVMNSNGMIVDEIEITSEMTEIRLNFEQAGMYFVQFVKDGVPTWNGKLTKM